jgi:hypothetical protein
VFMDRRSHGGTPTDVGRARSKSGWYQQLRAWWAARRAARQYAPFAACEHRWDVRREVVRPLPAGTAMDLAAAQGALSMATRLYGLTL